MICLIAEKNNLRIQTGASKPRPVADRDVSKYRLYTRTTVRFYFLPSSVKMASTVCVSRCRLLAKLELNRGLCLSPIFRDLLNSRVSTK